MQVSIYIYIYIYINNIYAYISIYMGAGSKPQSGEQFLWGELIPLYPMKGVLTM